MPPDRQYLVCLTCGAICSPKRRIPAACFECHTSQPWTFTDDRVEAIAIKKSITRSRRYEDRKRT